MDLAVRFENDAGCCAWITYTSTIRDYDVTIRHEKRVKCNNCYHKGHRPLSVKFYKSLMTPLQRRRSSSHTRISP